MSAPDISFIVIGYNEADNLRACIESVKAADTGDAASEIIYVDGGSTDNCIAISEESGVDRVIADGQRRRAAKNRNLGASKAQGALLHFVDGDMRLDASWPKSAIEYLEARPNVAAVSGHLVEADHGLWSRVLEIDWKHEVGTVEACGGAALFRRDAFEAAGGFPEDVRYGEEPLLCWRIRNEQGREIHHFDAVMAYHDLGLNGFGAYWRQYVRNGESYAEIAARCEGTEDPMWSRERQSNTVWAVAILLVLFSIVAAPTPIRLGLIVFALLVLLRKTAQIWRSGRPLIVAALYALHTYFCKLPLAYGQLRFRISPQK